MAGRSPNRTCDAGPSRTGRPIRNVNTAGPEIGRRRVCHDPRSESARQAVRQALYDGAGCIKVIVNGNPANVTLEEMKAIVEGSHLVGVKVAAHAIGNKATRIAAEASVDSIEHAYTVPDEVLKIMAEKHIYLVPTDGTMQTFEDMTFGTRTPGTKEKSDFEKEFQPYLDKLQDRLQRARKMGVPIAAGSDMYLTMPGKTRGQASLLVYEAYAAEGMTPMEIIRAATSNAAELLGECRRKSERSKSGSWLTSLLCREIH